MSYFSRKVGNGIKSAAMDRAKPVRSAEEPLRRVDSQYFMGPSKRPLPAVEDEDGLPPVNTTAVSDTLGRLKVK